MPFRRLRLADVGSTNDVALQLALEGEGGLPLVVRADRQTKGRGRGDHAWWSDGGSLTFSIMIDPRALGLRPEQEPRLALVAALALADTIAPWLSSGVPGIRWPNDVEIDGRKVAGILPEQGGIAEAPRVVVGIGLNVRSKLDDAPEEVRRMAASISEYREQAITDEDVEAIFETLLGTFADAVDRLARDDATLVDRWNELDQLAGRRVRVDRGTRMVEGVGGGIDERGGLRLIVGTETITLYGGQVLRD
ncbi:N/A [soil metagenome]